MSLGGCWELKGKDCFHPSVWREVRGGYAKITGFGVDRPGVHPVSSLAPLANEPP